MLALFRSRWLLLTVGVPVGAWLLDRVAAEVEERHGENDVTRVMRWPQARRHRHTAA